MGRRLDRPTSLKPRISVQNRCDSSISRTLITRWLMPPGVIASLGVSGLIGVVPSAIVFLQISLGWTSPKYKAASPDLPADRRRVAATTPSSRYPHRPTTGRD